MLTLKYPGVSS